MGYQRADQCTSIALTQQRRAKLDEMVKTLGIPRNQIIAQMIDNARIEVVAVKQPVTTISNKNKSAVDSAKFRDGAFGNN